MKRIVISILLSFLGPGLGQIYNKEYKKGTILLVIASSLFLLPMIWLVIALGPMLPDPRTEVIHPDKIQALAKEVIGKDRHLLNLISFTFLGIWAYAITQAYFKSKELNEKIKKEEIKE
ncbi:MAG: hypothetical protein A3I11_03290 [Elusimicrobia bacterium RIFCSPLOWO2_02_FULL_39_32]|nr:MAG: hypothetical protein A3B80_01860 [Elusimicrobia bacterium RIFCSPHIGHO2_02_FULL_39_36]OGR92733.1 MAG: hypothetical protein A3I11_03290 [Elusimicrobia bacterium RIFCSPLOWO2_02_FULL_39_32]OGR99517.1 MAG: hypothetical protein A3G85_00645 [Elusimicrobia bacterium RIFCSPLOWO2_12_FULL_39_28]